MVSAQIYIEGGASGPRPNGSSSRDVTIRCQQAFHILLDRMGFKGRKPRLIACGGRQSVYDRFRTALKASGGGYVAMWIDSEEPLADLEQAWKHLAGVKTVPAWLQPQGAKDDQVLFMTTCMETWIAADRDTLRAHYGVGLRINTLTTLGKLEQGDRHDVQDKLQLATKDCKNAYKKGKRSADVFEKLDPKALRKHLPSFARVERILNAKL